MGRSEVRIFLVAAALAAAGPAGAVGPASSGPADPGEGDRPPELVALKELNSDDMESGPWVTADGLTVYWTVFYHRLGPVIWTAKRPGPQAAFEAPRRLFAGAYPTLTADGLVMVLNRRGGLRMTRRDSVDRPFPRPVEIPELQDEPYCRRACLSEDGRTLYFERLRGGPRGGVELRVSRRPGLKAPWGLPTRLAIDPAKAGACKMVCPFVFRDGSMMLCADDRRSGQGTSNFMIWTRSRPDGPFDVCRYLEFPGLTAFGHCPRYVESTGELFFSTDRSARGRLDDARPDLTVIRHVRIPVDRK